MKFEDLKGETLIQIDGDIGSEEITFITDKNEKYMLYHEQDCCESVYVEDIIGDKNDLLETPILSAEESTNVNETPKGCPEDPFAEYFTWTFYKLSTIKGSVTIRWFGESNGYYSESVDFCKIGG